MKIIGLFSRLAKQYGVFFNKFEKIVSSVQGSKIVWCLLSRVAKWSGVFCPGWLKGVVSFVHPGKNRLVYFDPGLFCPAPNCLDNIFIIETSCFFFIRVYILVEKPSSP